MRRRIALAMVPVLGLLTGCSPAPQPLLALAVRDGRPIAVLMDCYDYDQDLSVSLDAEESAQPGVSPDWVVTGAGAGKPVEVALLSDVPNGRSTLSPDPGVTPQSWAWDPVGGRLSELRPGVRYRLSGFSGTSPVLGVEFTTADLERIGADQVLAPRDYRTLRIMDREVFLDRARDRCSS